MISNGSLITEEAARGMIDAGLDAINISVDASGKEMFEKTRLGLKYDKVIANIERLARAARREPARARPKLILSFVRQNNSADEQAFIEHWRKRRRQDPHHRPAQLGRHAEPASRTCNYPCYRPWLTFTVLWDGRVSLCCADFDGRHDPRRPAHVDDRSRSGTRRPTAPSAGSTSRPADPTICRSCDLPKKDSPLWVTKLLLTGIGVGDKFQIFAT